jgi:ankyrin repeat protein
MIMLLQAGAETLARDSDGHTAIEVAAIQGRRAVVEALLPHTSTSARPGVDPWTADALMEATKAERAAAEAARKEAGAQSLAMGSRRAM